MQAAVAPQVAPPVAAAAPAPAASPNYTPPPTNLPPTSMENGGGVEPSSGGGGSNKFKEFFSDINLLDVAISAFIVGGVIYTIHYYKFMMLLEKTGYADLSTRVQKLESSMAAAKKNAEVNASGNGRMKRKRALITL